MMESGLGGFGLNSTNSIVIKKGMGMIKKPLMN